MKLLICFVLSFFGRCTVRDIFLFDVRIRQLIKIFGNDLLDSEKQLSQLVSNPKIRLFRQSDLVTHIKPRYFRVTYANLIGGVYLGSVVVAVLIRNRVVLITGAVGGIGSAISIALIKAGHASCQLDQIRSCHQGSR